MQHNVITESYKGSEYRIEIVEYRPTDGDDSSEFAFNLFITLQGDDEGHEHMFPNNMIVSSRHLAIEFARGYAHDFIDESAGST